jgi:ribosome-associated translation inhibitor RaiA
MEVRINYSIRAGHLDTADAVREHAARKLWFALRRFRDRVRQVTVRVMDVNGPRRGVDTRCSITTDLVDGQRLFVEASAAVPFVAVTDAARRLSETLRRGHSREVAHRAAL